ncbi:DNA-binding protein RFXANK [Teleopsis dalmanni]|uniref:DNA-binding protein RFXANK n=1 Tax=Teleopsis dalmanni TaxID=139649 RepID=UPI0018CE2FA6|nr:DNA-binding protein RFXANK [Teleopsis dalmanni]XP_037957823.1 DNA-binding protein RFXANK [Teleopsis dalmanni]XP_037957824.1 DNA-binding protein RFXANK [Teleopsis dalmanni]
MSSPVNSPITNSEDEQSRLKWFSQRNEHLSPTSTVTPPPQSISATGSGVRPAGNILHDHNSTKRKSAFLPYRPHATVLTNLQRGNTEAFSYPVEITLSFHERAGQGEITEEQVNVEIEKQRLAGANIDFKDAYGFTPLHWAAYYGQLLAVQLLTNAGANVNSEAPDMVTPLLLAASGGHHEVVRFLLERGAKRGHMDIMGNTALMYAAAGNHPHTCNEILSRDPDMTASNENGDTAYTLAIEHGAVLAQSVLEQYIGALLAL